MILFDRPNLDDNVVAGAIEFSDGTTVPFGQLENDASRGTLVQFDPKTVTWLKINLTEVAPRTVNIGLAEVVVLRPKGGN